MIRANHSFDYRVENSELGKLLVRRKLMEKDIWPVAELGFSNRELALMQAQNIYFDKFKIHWLSKLAKLAVLEKRIQRHSISSILSLSRQLKKLSDFLYEKGLTQPEDINGIILRKFILNNDKCASARLTAINYSVRLWKEEGWINLDYVPPKIPSQEPKIRIIPEEILFKLYENLHLFPPMLERLFRLQIALGARLSEMLSMPRNCLKKEGNSWFMHRYIAKTKKYQFRHIDVSIAEIIQAQQIFLKEDLKFDDSFAYLFPKLTVATAEGCLTNTRNGSTRFERTPIYKPEFLSKTIIHNWLRAFNKTVDLRDKFNKKFTLQSHMFRRTKASIMAYCDTEDEYIAAVLGHSSLDMLPHYRKRSLDKLEKNAAAKGYVDKYGRITAIKPKKTRYENLSEIIKSKDRTSKVSTPLGECHRPSMLGDCQYRYACLSCTHHRVTFEDLKQLELDRKALVEDRNKAAFQEQTRKITEIDNLLTLVNNRIEGLENLKNKKGL